LTSTVAGRGAETEAHIREATRLSPRDVYAFRWFLIAGFAKFQLGKDAEAASWLLRSMEANRNYPISHTSLAAALALLGSLDQARTAAKTGLAIDPSFTIRRFREGASTDDPSYLTGTRTHLRGDATGRSTGGVTATDVRRWPHRDKLSPRVDVGDEG
jgi:tetratricopeptide (TPR) repeat protein